jgi:hypothetical protein
MKCGKDLLFLLACLWLALAGHVAAAEPGASPREAGAARGKANKGAKPGRPVFYSDIRKPVRVRRDLKENFLFCRVPPDYEPV